jgi:hypothetical protein
MNLEKNPSKDVQFKPKIPSHLQELKQRHHLLTLLKEWKQLIRIHVKPGDKGVVISQPNIVKSFAFEVLDLFGLSHKINPEDIEFEMVFSEEAIPQFLRAIRGSKLMSTLFEESDIQIWNMKTGDLEFALEENVAIKLNVKYNVSKGIFTLHVKYDMVRTILRQIPDAFPILIRMSSLQKHNS